jgi:hypothetical protein
LPLVGHPETASLYSYELLTYTCGTRLNVEAAVQYLFTAQTSIPPSSLSKPCFS